MVHIKPSPLLLVFISLVPWFTGCQTYNDQRSEVTDALRLGDFETAKEVIAKRANNADEKDKLLWLLEQGAINRITGDLEGSTSALDHAEGLINSFEEQAKVKVGSEAQAILTNQASLPYRGKEYEKIMMNTMKAANFMSSGDYGRARVEFNRTYQRQQNALEFNKKRIEKDKEAIEAAKQGELELNGRSAKYDAEAAMEDPSVSAKTQQILSEVEGRLSTNQAYADYVNPFAVFLEGVFFMNASLVQNDAERALKNFQRLTSMCTNPFVEQDLKLAESLVNGERITPVTYVIFETGFAPSLKEFRIDIPLYVVGSNLPYIGAALPRLVYNDEFVKELTASTSTGEEYMSVLLADMDHIVSKEFQNAWPSMLNKTLISSGVKGAIAYALQQSVKDESLGVQIAVGITVAAIQAGTTRADLRTWASLPKQYQYTRFPTPADGFVNLNIGSQNEAVFVEPNKTTVIIVRSVSPDIEHTITKFDLSYE